MWVHTHPGSSSTVVIRCRRASAASECISVLSAALLAA